MVLTAGFAVALPVFLVSSVPDAGRSDGWKITLGIMVWSGFRLAVLCVSGRPRLFDFFFWLFTYIFLGLAATVQIRTNEIAITTPQMDPTLDVPAAVFVVVGLAAYEVGRIIAASRRSARSPSADAPRVTSGLDLDEVRSVALGVAGLLMTTYFLSRVGVSSLFSSREAATAARNDAWADPAVRSIFDAASVYPLLIATGALAQIRRGSSSPAWRRVGGAGLLLGVVVLAVVENPVVNARYSFGTAAFAIAVFLGAARTAARVRTTMLATLAGFIFLFPLADAFRYSDQVRATRGGFFGEYVANGDYDSFWQIANAYQYWQDGLVQPLRQIMGSLLFWVPRAIWPHKPTDTGILLAQYRGYSFENLSAPMWAEALVNAGAIGVVVVFLMLGYVVARMDGRLSGVFVSGGAWGIIGAVFPVYMVILLRGSLLQATGAVVIATACVLFVGRRSTHPPPQ